ncbi:MAG: thioredoxin domain-containing protein [Xanthobacteraceae bacterium]
MTSASNPSHENRLARETSPYLLQHKSNPVDWWPWGPEALAEARRTGKPILLSIGYAACHWCHVMAHESFEDPATAAVMNELFVNIKVDREERPDIDQIYMQALHLLGQPGGWPLTMILNPDGEPIWGGTYFPNVSRFGRPSFVQVLHEISRLFREEPNRIEQNRTALMAALAEKAQSTGQVSLGLPQLDGISKQLADALDPLHGGLQGAPKFPQCTMLEFLWRAGQRVSAAAVAPHPMNSADNAAASARTSGLLRRSNFCFDAVELALERMSEGGIYDHLGGGFSRYSVDERWLVPHFEKMLYDNSQLLELLALAHAHTGHTLFRARAAETVDWLAREMTTPDGAFCASLDADSEGEEGKFYVWSAAEVAAVLGGDAAFFAEAYDVTPEGNFEGHNILNRLGALDDFARARAGQPFVLRPFGPEAEDRLAVQRAKLLGARERRVRPGLDDKVLADWNGLMISALANAGTLLARPDWVDLGRRAFDFVAGRMTRGDRLGHSWRDGRLLFPGLASDFAAMIRAALALFEATGEAPYLARAIAWQHAFDRHYANPDNGGYYLTADDAEGLIFRPSATTDDAIPNPNGLAAQNLVRLAALTGDDGWRERADILFAGLLPIAASNLFGHLSLLNALDLRLRGAQIVIVRTKVHNEPHNAPLIAAAQQVPFNEKMLLRLGPDGPLPPSHPAREKIAAVSDDAAFVCVGEVCSLPLTDPSKIDETIARLRHGNPIASRA